MSTPNHGNLIRHSMDIAHLLYTSVTTNLWCESTEITPSVSKIPGRTEVTAVYYANFRFDWDTVCFCIIFLWYCLILLFIYAVSINAIILRKCNIQIRNKQVRPRTMILILTIMSFESFMFRPNLQMYVPGVSWI